MIIFAVSDVLQCSTYYNMARISFLFLILLLIGVSCKNGQHYEGLDESSVKHEIINDDQKVKIDLGSIEEVFSLATNDFYARNLDAFRSQDTIKAIIDRVGLAYYDSLFYELLHEEYVPMGCTWANIRIVRGGELISKIIYGDESNFSFTDCKKIFSSKNALQHLESKTSLFDCSSGDDKMIIEDRYLLSHDVEISLNLLFVTAG